ncbi:unnamed protein product [Polarella glacialis]|uniref:Uncharacterized protein n=2 Tax=Polarella glacialis TaxID=89957 RepID=A0A813GBP6_POLGL|nr:unnamed protein product [Polarella glacialis]
MDTCLPCVCPDLPFVLDPQRASWVCEENPYHSAGDVVCLSADPEETEEMAPDELPALRAQSSGQVTGAFLQAISQLAQRKQGPVTYQGLLAEMSTQLAANGGLRHRKPRLSSSQAFDTTSRSFRFFDALHNSNPEVGIRSRRINRSLR